MNFTPKLSSIIFLLSIRKLTNFISNCLEANFPEIDTAFVHNRKHSSQRMRLSSAT